MRLSRVWSVLLLALLAIGISSLAAGEEAEELSRVFLYFQNGTRPTLSGDVLLSTKTELQDELGQFAAMFEKNMSTPSTSCRRYGRLVSALSKDLRQQIGKVQDPAPLSAQSDGEFLSRVRLRLLIPAFFGLSRLLQNHREGGYSSLDPKMNSTCDFEDRGWAENKMDALSKQLVAFHRQALGNPGLLQLDHLSSRLLKLADQQGAHRRMVSNEVLAVTTITSLLFWAYAPVAAVAVAGRVLGVVPDFVMNPVFAFGVRTTALTGETFAYRATSDALVPPSYEPPELLMMGWEDQMAEIEQLVRSNPASADVYWPYLNQIKLQLAALFQPWITQHANELKTPVGFIKNAELEINQMLGLIREAHFFSDASIRLARKTLADLIRHDYNYVLDCQQSIFGGASDEECLSGMRTLARLLYSKKLPKLTVDQSHVTRVTIRPQPSFDINESDSQLNLSVGFETQPKFMMAAVWSVLQSSSFTKLADDAAAFRQAAQSLQINLAIPVTFSQSETRAAKWQALTSLVDLTKEHRELFDKLDGVVVGSNFSEPYEKNLELLIDIDATAPPADIIEYLTMIRKSIDYHRASLDRVKEQMDALGDSLHQFAGLAVSCNPNGPLSTTECFTALIRLRVFLLSQPQVKLGVNRVVITAVGDLDSPVETVSTNQPGEHVLLLRSDFDGLQLRQLAIERGWLHE